MKKSKSFYGFTCQSRQDYSVYLAVSNKKERITDRIMFGIYTPEGGCEAEMGMVWHKLRDDLVFPRIEIFSDAFGRLKQDTFIQLIHDLSYIPNPEMTPEDFSNMLVGLGFKDMSDNPLEENTDGSN